MFLISFGICSTPKLSKYIMLLPFTYNKAIQRVPNDSYSSKFIKYAPFFVYPILYNQN